MTKLRTFRARKPDGWHIYHICGDELREPRKVTDNDGNASLMCVVCGEWFDWTVTSERLAASNV